MQVGIEDEPFLLFRGEGDSNLEQNLWDSCEPTQLSQMSSSGGLNEKYLELIYELDS